MSSLRLSAVYYYFEWFDGVSTPPTDHVAAIHNFLWRKPGTVAKTKGFRNRGHDALHVPCLAHGGAALGQVTIPDDMRQLMPLRPYA